MLADHAPSVPHNPFLREAGANESLLLTKTKRLRWILEGPGSDPLLALCEEQCTALAGFVTRIEERRRALDDMPVAAIGGSIEPSVLPRPRTSASSVEEAVQDLFADHDTIRLKLRDYLGSGGGEGPTTVLLRSVLEGHEAMAGALRSYLGSRASPAPR